MLVRSFRGHTDAVSSVVFHTNMKQLISGGLDGNVMVWNFKPQLRALRFAGHKVQPRVDAWVSECRVLYTLWRFLPLGRSSLPVPRIKPVVCGKLRRKRVTPLPWMLTPLPGMANPLRSSLTPELSGAWGSVQMDIT